MVRGKLKAMGFHKDTIERCFEEIVSSFCSMMPPLTAATSMADTTVRRNTIVRTCDEVCDPE